VQVVGFAPEELGHQPKRLLDIPVCLATILDN
jgi:hypothetical protein